MSADHQFVEIVERAPFHGAVVPLDEQASADVVELVGKRFVTRPNSCWWWEHLRDDLPQHSFAPPNNDGYLLLPSVCPDKPVLFFVSDDEEPPWLAYRARPSDLARAMAECAPFEYVVADPDGDWLLMENHHGMPVAVGEPVVSALAKYDVEHLAGAEA